MDQDRRSAELYRINPAKCPHPWSHNKLVYGHSVLYFNRSKPAKARLVILSTVAVVPGGFYAHNRTVAGNTGLVAELSSLALGSEHKPRRVSVRPR